MRRMPVMACVLCFAVACTPVPNEGGPNEGGQDEAEVLRPLRTVPVPNDTPNDGAVDAPLAETGTEAAALDITGALGAPPSATTPQAETLSAETPTAEIIGESADAEAPQTAVSATPLLAPQSRLVSQDPSVVRLATIGASMDIISDDSGVLGHTMWRNTTFDAAMRLFGHLPVRPSSRHIDRLVRHIMVSYAMPPEGALAAADTYLAARLEWLRARGLSDARAALVRQLPDDARWLDEAVFLIGHDLITRNDIDACALGERMAPLDDALDNNGGDDNSGRAEFWAKLRIFCNLRLGEEALAAFRFDLLAERGSDDALFLGLIRARLEGGAVSLPQEIAPTALNLALMDLEQVPITGELRAQMPLGLAQSLARLNYVDADAAYIQHGIGFYFRHQILAEQLAIWRDIAGGAIAGEGVPVAVPLATALTQFLDTNTDPLTESSQRIMFWHSLLGLASGAEKQRLAVLALAHDMERIGGGALAVWAPHLTPQSALGGDLLAIAGMNLPSFHALTPQQSAWVALEDALLAGEVSQAHLRLLEAQDAAPLLARIGVAVGDIAPEDAFSGRGVLAVAPQPLAYADMQILAGLDAALAPAESVLLVAAILGTTPLQHLSHQDAAVLAGVLYDAGLVVESRRFALEILRSWGGYRRLKMAERTDAGNS